MPLVGYGPAPAPTPQHAWLTGPRHPVMARHHAAAEQAAVPQRIPLAALSDMAAVPLAAPVAPLLFTTHEGTSGSSLNV